jgi:hypothetical protein
VFYLLKYGDRASVCFDDTNRLEWKKCRHLLAKNQVEEEDLFTLIGNYWPFSPKEDEYKEYQKLVFVKDNIDSLEEAAVDGYSIALGQLFRWLKQAIDLRIDNVKERRAANHRMRDER